MRFFLIIYIFFAVSSLNAAEIKSAFGLNLGEVFSEDLRELSETTSGEKIYQFGAKNPHPSFLYYGVIITPKSKRIAQIWAWNDYDSSAECKSQFKIVKSLLDDKYGVFLDKDSFSFSSESAAYYSGKKSISLRCPIKFGNNPLYLQYIDDNINEISVKEKAAETNSKGL
tara:strand:+ start:15 stop:524 length:510 start_codon:yes stop_codon:yes gene_type:complete